MNDIDSHSQSVNRRSVLRLIGGGTLALAGIAAFGAGEASAARGWCRADPEFRINGKLLHVYISGSQQLHDVATGPTDVTLTVPRRGVDVQFVWADEGFGGLGYDVKIIEVDWLEVEPASGAVPFVVKACVPAQESLAIEAEAVHEHKNGRKTTTDQRQGKTNRSMTLRGKL
jgi:hypothetical protein